MKQWRFFGFIPPMLVAGLLLVLVFGAIVCWLLCQLLHRRQTARMRQPL